MANWLGWPAPAEAAAASVPHGHGLVPSDPVPVPAAPVQRWRVRRMRVKLAPHWKGHVPVTAVPQQAQQAPHSKGHVPVTAVPQQADGFSWRHQGNTREASSADLRRARFGPTGGFRYKCPTGGVSKKGTPSRPLPTARTRRRGKEVPTSTASALEEELPCDAELREALRGLPWEELPARGRRSRQWQKSHRGLVMCRLAARRRACAPVNVRPARPCEPSAFAHRFTSVLPLLTATLVTDHVRFVLRVKNACAAAATELEAPVAAASESRASRLSPGLSLSLETPARSLSGSLRLGRRNCNLSKFIPGRSGSFLSLSLSPPPPSSFLAAPCCYAPSQDPFPYACSPYACSPLSRGHQPQL